MGLDKSAFLRYIIKYKCSAKECARIMYLFSKPGVMQARQGAAGAVTFKQVQ